MGVIRPGLAVSVWHFLRFVNCLYFNGSIRYSALEELANSRFRPDYVIANKTWSIKSISVRVRSSEYLYEFLQTYLISPTTPIFSLPKGCVIFQNLAIVKLHFHFGYIRDWWGCNKPMWNYDKKILSQANFVVTFLFSERKKLDFSSDGNCRRVNRP